MAPLPRVSVCIPVYRSEEWVGGAIESVLAQSYGDFEIVVVDNQSPDATTEVVRRFDDERIRLYVNPTNLGPVVNHNRAVDLARGSLIKVLHADDRLAPDCLERMVAVLDEHERVGFVFARRQIEMEQTRREQIWFKQRSRSLHRGFRDLQPINDGQTLFKQYLNAGFPWNWVGEQTAVMIRRECFERLGLFNERIWQGADMEMWVRTMLAYDVGFIDDELVHYRFGHDNLTAANLSVKRHWLDRLWVYETLKTQDPSLKYTLARLQRTEYLYVGREMVRTLLARRGVGERMRDLQAYGACRIRQRRSGPTPVVQQVSALKA